jgi:hypothetical protein
MRKGTCVVAVGLLALAVAGCGGSGGGSSGSGKVTVDLGQQNGSGESGTATLTKEGDKTKVEIDLTNGSDTAQPAHIHKGTCAKLNPTPEYALTNVQSGKSTTTVDASLDTLQKAAYAINVHKSSTDLKTYVSCGDIGVSPVSSGGGGGSKY